MTKAKREPKVLQFPKQKQGPAQTAHSAAQTGSEVQVLSPEAVIPLVPAASTNQPSFILFAEAIMAGRTSEAAGLLVALLSIDHGTALYAAEFFWAAYQKDNAVLAKAQSIRHDLQNQQVNDVLTKIYDCFGLQGLEALHLLQGFQKWLNC